MTGSGPSALFSRHRSDSSKADENGYKNYVLGRVPKGGAQRRGGDEN
jgi:hypothetical protein